MRKRTEEIVKEINPEFSIHDFRMTDGGDRVNLIFDLVISPDTKMDREELKNMVQQKIHSVNDKYYAVPKIENSYIWEK